MRVFISWSGDSSRKIAKILHDWLPSVLQSVKPYMSAESIDKGERWSNDISSQLQETNYGIICITPQNIEAPWILFESGALSKSMQNSKVSPIIFGLEPSDLSKSPLLQFQITKFSRDEINKLVHSLNNSAPEAEKVSPTVADKSFARAWPELEESVSEVDVSFSEKTPTSDPAGGYNALESAVQEILTNTRTQIKLLKSPADIIPADYLGRVLTEVVSARDFVPKRHPVWRILETNLLSLDNFVTVLKSAPDTPPSMRPLCKEIISTISEIRAALRFVAHGTSHDRRTSCASSNGVAQENTSNKQGSREL